MNLTTKPTRNTVDAPFMGITLTVEYHYSPAYMGADAVPDDKEDFAIGSVWVGDEEMEYDFYKPHEKKIEALAYERMCELRDYREAA